MTFAIVNTVANILAGIKLNKIPDKETKTILVKDYLLLKQLVKKVESTKQDIIDKFQSDWKDEISEVDALRQENKPIEGHKEYLEAEIDAIKMINDAYGEDVEVNFTPIELDKFLTAVGDEALTLETISFLKDNGVVE